MNNGDNGKKVLWVLHVKVQHFYSRLPFIQRQVVSHVGYICFNNNFISIFIFHVTIYLNVLIVIGYDVGIRRRPFLFQRIEGNWNIIIFLAKLFYLYFYASNRIVSLQCFSKLRELKKIWINPTHSTLFLTIVYTMKNKFLPLIHVQKYIYFLLLHVRIIISYYLPFYANWNYWGISNSLRISLLSMKVSLEHSLYYMNS